MKRIKELFKDKMILALLAALLVTTVIIIALVISKMDFNHNVELLDFSKLTQSEIVEWFNKEFENDDNIYFKKEYSETVEKGKVISQSIKPGEIINKDSKVVVIISKGSDPNLEISLPDFVNEKYTKDMIDKFFFDNKFTDVTYEYEISELPKDTVIKVNVEQKAKRGDLILVTLSVGDNPELVDVKVPDFSTYTVNSAKAWGKTNAITIRVNYAFSDKFEEGKVISQSVKADEIVKGGSTITLQVSSGKGIEIKDLSGMTFKQADKWSDDVGVYIKPIYVYHDKIKEDIVIKTDPKPGTIVKKGDVIDLYVSKGVDPENVTVEVKSYVGKTETELLDYLKKLELKSVKSTSYYSDTIAKGSVISHTTGEVKMSDKIEYNLSLGSYILDLKDFEGVSKLSADQVINSANSLKANVNLKVSESVNSDTYGKDVLFECSINEKTVTCKLSKGALATVENFVGQNKQSDFSYNGVNYKIVVDSEYTDGSNYGDVHSQSVEAEQRVEQGTTVELYVRKGSETKAYIPNEPSIYDNDSESFDKTSQNIMNILKDFKNITINRVYDSEYTPGKIKSISVNGNSSFEAGSYPITSTIVFEIYDKE